MKLSNLYIHVLYSTQSNFAYFQEKNGKPLMATLNMLS